ncbi:MAG: RusA family crossover junction endodeoxyribonuclease [Oricola sp.]|nr:RusA family crossover junction endodeoxyribonuclease [Oricola sp.]MCI5073964.1 RusA family crossover junction endodeoxyribonuclease [Oricola sp.]
MEFIAPLPKGRREPGRVAIADAFRAAFPDRAPTTSTIAIHVFAEVPPAIAVADVDNLLKPVLDALSGVAYFDDTQISECLVRRIPAKERRLLIRLWSVPTELLVRGLPATPLLA